LVSHTAIKVMLDIFSQSSSIITVLRLVCCLIGPRLSPSQVHTGAGGWGGRCLFLQTFNDTAETLQHCSCHICRGYALVNGLTLKGYQTKQENHTYYDS